MYYNVRLDWDPKVIGVKNGIYQVELDRKAYDKKTYSLIETMFINNVFSADQVNPEVDFIFYFKRLKSAKNTSFISFTPNLKHCHFLIKKNLIKLFEGFNIQEYVAYDSIIYDSSGENVDDSYQLFYLVLQNWSVIDFNNSVFTVGGFGNNPIVELKFENEFALNNYRGIPNVSRLCLNEKFDSKLDLFLTRLGGLFVSDKLKLALELNQISGLRFYNDVEVLLNS
jgi:hypothetical protein